MKKFIPVLLLTLLFAGQFITARAQATPQPVVRAVMFWMNGCPHCEDVIQNVLPPLREKYGAQFDLFMIEVVDMQDVDALYAVSASYNFTREQTGVPFLVIGRHVLTGSDQVREQLPSLIDGYLAEGGVDWPTNPALADLLPKDSALDLPVVEEAPVSADLAPEAPRNNGFSLAIVIMVGMGLALLYSIVSFAMGRTFSLPAWADWLTPALILIGIGVAGYLSYVETQSVAAMCGPIGDCNTVQQSRYAVLFDILPIGVLGMLGYLGMLAAWLTRKFFKPLEKLADLGFYGMAFFAVVFSLYLTYLEPFVIRAVCIWCLSSAVIVTLLLILGTPPAVRQFSIADEAE
jgi:uncharacterized membrane protein